jgi:hypothetical protein
LKRGCPGDEEIKDKIETGSLLFFKH